MIQLIRDALCPQDFICAPPSPSFILILMDPWKDKISFILVDTLEPGNIGASARALKNLGFPALELVRPRRFPADEADWFAHGAEDILAAVRVHDSLAPALKEKAVVIGTTRRTGKKRGLVYAVREGAARIREFAQQNRVALLFGREDRGLTNDQTAACSFMLHIPAAPANPSFNLAQAVLIVAYELASSGYAVSQPPSVISQGDFENLFVRVAKIMDMAGYKPKGIRDDREEIMADLKRIMARAGITDRDARMLHGIISQIEESLGRK